MPQPLPTNNDRSSQPLLPRLNRAIGEINVFLLALALGLATLDFTCFVMLRVVEMIAQLPPTGG